MVIRMTEIKVCGITSTKEALWLMEEKVEYAGMVLFQEEHKKNVRMDSAYSIIRVLQSKGKEQAPKAVAVTKSPSIEQIAMIQKLGFDYIQVSGKLEKNAYETIVLPIIREVNTENLGALNSYIENEKVEGILLNITEYLEKKKVDWSLIREYTDKIKSGNKKCILAGEKQTDYMEKIIQQLQPDMVEVNEEIESLDNQEKDRVQMHRLVNAVRI